MNYSRLLKVFILPFVGIGFSNFIFAQTNFNLLMKSGEIAVEKNVDDFIKNTTIESSEIILGKYYRIVQFSKIPNSSQRKAMEQAGMEFLNYLPNHAYTVAFSKDFDLKKLKNFNVRAVLEFENKFKLDKTLIVRPFGYWAVHGSKVDVALKFFENIPLNFCQRKNRKKKV